MVLDLFRLDGRVALVTGGARGIGRAIALGLAEAGADVAVLDLLPTDETGREVVARGRRVHLIERDLRDAGPEEAAGIVADVVGEFGRLDVMVNNAGIIRRAPAVDYARADWDDTLAVDLSAAFFLSQAAARHWLGAGQGGKVINLASMLSFQGGLNVVAYTAAKSGLAGLTRALANEWARYGINVNALAPGYLATEVTAGLRADPARAAAVLARIPAGRWGEPEDVQGAAVFLASDAGAYLHGVVLPVDGGWLAW